MGAPLRTFADVKRRCVLGARLEMIHHGNPNFASLLPMPRTITKVQTNAIAMSPWPGKTEDSWLWWRGARSIRIDGPDTFSVLDEKGIAYLTYRFI